MGGSKRRLALALVLSMGLHALLLLSPSPVPVSLASPVLSVTLSAAKSEGGASVQRNLSTHEPPVSPTRVHSPSPVATPRSSVIPPVLTQPGPANQRAIAPATSPATSNAGAVGAVVTSNATASGPVTRPRFLGDVSHPPYPELSREQGEQGVVRVMVTVGTDGQALDAEVTHSSGYARLDAAALALLSAGPFAPAQRGNSAFVAKLNISVNYTLQD